MTPEISRLAAKIVQGMPMAEKLRLIPYVEKAKSLKDIPQPWRDQMQAIKDNPASWQVIPHEKPDTQGTITEHKEEQ